MSNKVLVTGGSGLVGNNVVRELLDRGDTVRALKRSTTPLEAYNGLDVELIDGDLCDDYCLRKAARGVDAIVHAAGMVHIGWSYPSGMRETNVEGTRNVVEAAKRADARLVHVSTVNALAVPRKGQPLADEETPFTGQEVPADYVMTKISADQCVSLAMLDGLCATIVYPGFVLGPYDWKPTSGRMMQAVAKKFLPVAPSGGITVTDSRDLAKTICSICRRPPPHDHYIVADHPLPYFDLWKKMANVTGGSAPLWRMKTPLRRIIGFGSDFWTRMTGNEPELNSALLAMSRQFHYYDSSRAKSELDYQPRALDETLKDAWDWLKDRQAA